MTVEYRSTAPTATTSSQAAEELGRVRRRDGAFRWNVFEDLQRPGVYLETFLVDSWEEHLRQHGRFTVSDVELEQRVQAFHRGEEPPVVRHLLRARRAAPEPGPPSTG